MAKSTKQLVNLAKGGAKKPAPVKKEVVPEVVLTKEEERDLKAKEVVKELLSDSDVDLTLTAKPKEDLFELEDQEPTSGDIWLQEQVAALTSENAILKSELDVMRVDFQKMLNENQRVKSGAGLQNDGELKKGVLTIFHEIQSNYLKNPGLTPYGTPNFVIVPPAFLNRLIVYFPFLQGEKRF